MRRYNIDSIRRTVDSVIEPVDLVEAKNWLRVEHTRDDILISSLITAARLAAEGYLHTAIITQTWTLKCLIGGIGLPLPDLSTNPITISLPRTPAQAITSVTVRNSDNTTIVIPNTDYYINDNWLSITQLPQTVNAYLIEIVFTAGRAVDAASVPQAIKTGVLTLVSYFYERRGDDQGEMKIPEQAKVLLRPYKVMLL